jgi:hypothetical protein
MLILSSLLLLLRSARKMNGFLGTKKEEEVSPNSGIFFFSTEPKKQFLFSPVRLPRPIILQELWRQRKLQKWANLSLLGKVRQIKEFVRELIYIRIRVERVI